MHDEWLRVSRARPCVQCGKPDWCTYTQAGVVCCMRIESDKPAANGGWIHNATTRPLAASTARPKRKAGYDTPDFDAALWWATARTAATAELLKPWADRLGLPLPAVDWTGGCTVGEMLCFPMHDGEGNVCGIRTRDQNGNKRAVTGSKAGVFLATVQAADEVVICEGPTDAAAALALGYEPIGRPSCTGSERHVADTLKRWDVEQATVCADADGPGMAGAERLRDVLRAARVRVRLVTPGGHKDLRDWLKAGATRVVVEAMWGAQRWV